MVLEALITLVAFPVFPVNTNYKAMLIETRGKPQYKKYLYDDLREFLVWYDRKQKHFPSIENSNLCDRKNQVARLICKGQPSKEIGEILYLSKHTVDTHRRSILENLPCCCIFFLQKKCFFVLLQENLFRNADFFFA